MVSLFFCANTAAPLSASSSKETDFNESRFLSFSCLFCRGSILINQRLRHFHRCLALIQAQRQIRCRTGIEQQAALEFTVAAERGQAREIGLGKGEQQPSVLLLDLRNPLLAGLGTQQRDIQQRDSLRRRLTEAVDQLVKHITALLVRADKRDTAVQIDTLPRIRNIISGKIGRNQQLGRTINTRLGCFSLLLLHSLFEQLEVQIIADAHHVAGLLGTKHIAGTANFQITHGNLEARAERRELTNRAKALSALPCR